MNKLHTTLQSPHPWAHEMAQGHWDVPKDVIEGKLQIDRETNARLFQDFPNWCVIAVVNPEHTYDVIDVDGTRYKGKGVWWIWEAHPNMTPREWGPAFPVMFRKHSDGEMWVDRERGVPMHPGDCYGLIVKTLHYKDLYNTARFPDLGDNIRFADAANEQRDSDIERRVAVLRAEVLKDELVDQSTVKGGSKQFVPSTYEGTEK